MLVLIADDLNELTIKESAALFAATAAQSGIAPVKRFPDREGVPIEINTTVNMGGVLVVPAEMTVEEYLGRMKAEGMTDVTPPQRNLGRVAFNRIHAATRTRLQAQTLPRVAA